MAGIEIYYEHYRLKKPLATIVLAHGFGENIMKYRELIYYFLQEGYEVFAMEHRGHGRSGRSGLDSTQVHVESWKYYVDDLEKFVTTIVKPQSKIPLLLFGHSMGGGISAALLLRQPSLFHAAVLSVPRKDYRSLRPHVIGCIA